MIIILIPPTIAEIVVFSFSPNSTTSFGYKKNPLSSASVHPEEFESSYIK